MTERDVGDVSENGGVHRRSGAVKATAGWLRETTPKVRTGIARLIWLLALAAALALGAGALLVVLKANPDNVLVSAVVGTAEWLDGPFADVFTFSDRVQQTLVNWGLAAVAYLIAGGVLARLIRP
ncbi:MAG: hypothetical protein ACRDT4_21155 [Micromonosporaceae bacterium]